MKLRASLVISCFLTLLSPFAASGDGPWYLTDFRSLDGWRTVELPKVDRRASLELVSEEGAHALRVRADDAAAALLLEQEFPTAEVESLGWRWRAAQVPATGDPSVKQGDDYVLRVMVLFKESGALAGLFDSLFGGDLMPDSSIHYVWSAAPLPAPGLVSPYTRRVRLVSLRSGFEGNGEWRDERVDIRRDYRALFGTEPPDRFMVAIMTDTDNSHTVGEAEITAFELRRSAPAATP